MKGEVIYFYAYDIAYEANLAEIEKKMLGAAERFQLGRLRDAPRDFPVYRPLSIQMEETRLETARGPVTFTTSVKLFALGAISVKVRVPVSFEHVMDLLAFRNLRFTDGTTLDGRVQEIA